MGMTKPMGSMTMRMVAVTAVAFVATVGWTMTACNKPTDPIAPAPVIPDTFKLAQSPTTGERAEVLGVADAVTQIFEAGNEPTVVVEGRVQRYADGVFAIHLADMALLYCGQTNTEDKCPEPWDYCCEDKAKIKAGTMYVEFVGADGKPAARPTTLGVRYLDHVRVIGKLVADEVGNIRLEATGYFIVARPTLPDFVRWEK